MCSDAAFDRQDRQLVPRLLIELNARFALAEVIGIVLVCFLLGGELVPSVNEPHYLTRAKRYWDPSFCVGDFFLSSRDAHGVFFASLGWMTQFVSLATTAWIGRLLAWTLLAIGWHQLCRSLILTRGASLLSATIWFTLVQHVHMSGEWLLGGIEGKVFAYGFVLWGLSYFVTGKWNRTWILLGVASAFHVLVGGWTVCLALLATVIPLSDLQQRQRRWNLLRASWPGLVIGGTIALLGLVPALQLNRALPAAVKERAVEIYVFDRLSHHLLVGDFKFPFIIRHLGAIGLFVAIWIPLRKQLAFGRIADIVWGAIGLAIVGAGLELAFGDSLWCARLARYYWFRCSDVFVPLGISLGVVLVAHQLGRSRPHWARIIVALVAATACANVIQRVNWLHFQVLPAADRQGGIQQAERLVEWRAVCGWIDQRLPPTAVCLTPSDHQTFKWYAQRGEVVTWKDVPQDAAALVEWSERMARVSRWQNSASIEESDQRLNDLTDRYECDYLVVRLPAEFPLPRRRKLYQNSDYAVFEARSSHSSSRP